MKKIFNHTTPLFLITLFVSFFLFLACQKEDDFNSDPNLRLDFSNDSVVFDTVFSSIGSITKQLRVYNNSNEKANISSIRLLGGESSQYRINVDGSPTLLTENIELAANDSLFIFVRVTIDPTIEDAPFIVNDKIEFITNGNEQKIELVSWGQNANYIIGNQLSSDGKLISIIAEKDQDITWNSPKPYVIYGTAKIDTNAILRIPEGCQIYFHNESGIWASPNSAIKITGTKQNPVILKGDRLDEYYRDLPEQWNGITIEGSNQSTDVNYAIIENAKYGIRAISSDLTKTNQLNITNTIIRNMTEFGISSKAFSIQSNNCLIANCGDRLLNLELGGVFDFKHCTFANYWTYSLRSNPSILLSNSAVVEEQTLFNSLNANFGNCIIDGRNTNELETKISAEASFTYSFTHCSLKSSLNIYDPAYFIDCIANPENIFADTETSGFKLHEESLVIDIGLESIGQSIPFDIYGTSRLPNPDLGAIEYKPEEEN